MRVCILNPKPGCFALMRVKDALMRYAPEDIEFAPADKADLTIINVIGRQDGVRRTARNILNKNREYAVIQYCLRSTQKSKTDGWLPLWAGANVVWSYLDLQQAAQIDDVPTSDVYFYHAPLGVDAGVFKPLQQKRRYAICTSGLYRAESVREAILAAKQVGRKVLHLGPELNHQDVECHSGLTDEEVAEVYNQCEFVSGLRRIEGFELPAAEGLLCGARPIVFDRSHYRKWYKPWAEFIPEGSQMEVIESLASLFKRGARAVTKQERMDAARFFDWRPIVTGFWDRCLNT